MADWSRVFDDPVPLPRGRQLVTLKDAANYIQKLPKAEQQFEEWQAAVEALLLVVELNGPTMTAAPITSAGRFSPLGPRGIRPPSSAYQRASDAAVIPVAGINATAITTDHS
jgi:hypothetical protein